MRASRLVSLLLLLQARGRLTADELAEELEVSPRTIYRDLFELGAAGVPVYGERGKGGGYHLLDGYRTNLTGPAAELGLGSLLAATRLKLLAAVPPGLRETATRAESRFYLDPGGWAHSQARDDRHLRIVAQAVWNDRRLEITHRRSDGQRPRRTLDPLGLVHKTGVWYLVAIHAGSPRVYRVDRILSAQESGAEARRPDGFDLTAYWSAWEAEYAASLPAFSVQVRLGPLARRHRDDLGALSPRAVSANPPDASGWVEQTLLFDDRRVAVAALLALAPEVEIIAPLDLRNDLIATATRIIARQRATPPP